MTESKEQKIKKILDAQGTDMRNSMGCNESWYDAYYAVGHTFHEDELRNMSESEIDHLIKLADNISSALY
jgi:hypothetical protein